MKFTKMIMDIVITLLLTGMCIVYIEYPVLGFSIFFSVVVIAIIIIIMLFEPSGKFKYPNIIRRK